MDANRPDESAPGPNDPDSPRSGSKKPSSSSRSDKAEDTAAFGVNFVPGAPPAEESGEAPPGPEVHVPSEEAASFGFDPDHGVKAGIPLADAEIPIPFGEDFIPVKSVFGLTLKGWAAIGGIVLAALGGVGGLGLASGQDEPDPGPGPDYSTTAASGIGGETSEASWGTDPGYEDPGSGDETTEIPEPDPIAEASVGECYDVYGEDFDAEIEWAACGVGTFEVIDIAEGTTDLNSCDWIEYANQAVTSTESNRVLCLAYIVVDGDDAYRAVPGECVYGTSGSGEPWRITGCDTGEFKVLERIEGVADSSSCDDVLYGAHSRYYTTGESYMDVTLCLQIIYPDDIGYAEQYSCMWTDGDNYFEFSDCDTANARVMGRTNEYEASYWCEGYGWATWTNYDFPEHAYTVCWEWY